MFIIKSIKTAIIPVAGKGTRFLPVSKEVCKTMFPIINKPTLQYLIEECVNFGITNFVIVINEEQASIKDYFDLNSVYYDSLQKSYDELDILHNLLNTIKVDFVIQEEPNGLGDAIKRCESKIDNDAFAVILGDDLVIANEEKDYGIGSLIKNYEKKPGYYIGIKEVELEQTKKYGVVKLDGDKIIDIVEKPKMDPPSNLAVIGRYILERNVFKYLEDVTKDQNNEIQLTSALAMAIDHDDIYACKFNGEHFDIGSHAGYVKANIKQSLNDKLIRNDIYEYILGVTHEKYK